MCFRSCSSDFKSEGGGSISLRHAAIHLPKYVPSFPRIPQHWNFLPLLHCCAYVWLSILKFTHTDIRRLTTEICSEKCAVRRFRPCANVIECTYTNLDCIAYYTPSQLLLGYKPVQQVIVLNTVGYCNTVFKYYNIIIVWDHRRICGPSLTETSLYGAYMYLRSFKLGGTMTLCTDWPTGQPNCT